MLTWDPFYGFGELQTFHWILRKWAPMYNVNTHRNYHMKCLTASQQLIFSWRPTPLLNTSRLEYLQPIHSRWFTLHIRPVEAVRQSIADATAHVVARADAPKAATGARGLLAAAAAAGGRFAASNA